jgi:GNAT superfamily N-acetyltransferase
MHIREIDPRNDAEIELVAARMRDTLIEVEGHEVGGALYTIEWLRERVRWHLNPQTAIAKIFLAIDADEEIIGHTIVRKEIDEHGNVHGLFSTTYVVPAARKTGTADKLLSSGERWMMEVGLPSAATWTSATNAKLIALYAKRGYVETAQHVHEVTGTVMVKLERNFAAASSVVESP